MKQEWFAEWFDSPYYHTLYKHRDEKEAKAFIGQLIGELNLAEGSAVLDLACGKGRHAITLNELGFDVLGADLSANSIHYAKQFENDKLHFVVHDMREVINNKQFDAVFNLFTSFGYFDDLHENERVVAAVHSMLKPKGLFIIDFLNAHHVLEHLVADETKSIDGIDFHIQRTFDGAIIRKSIAFSAEGKPFAFEEKVQAIQLGDFEQMLAAQDFKIIRTFGDFALRDFDLKNSKRLIIIAQRN